MFDDDDFLAFLLITNADTSGLNWKGVVLWIILITIILAVIVAL